MRVVLALGGNALLRRGDAPEADVQLANLRAAVQGIAEIAEAHELIVTHGNGPQVGLLALQGEAHVGAKPYSLDILDAETEGMLGYMIEQELSNAIPDRDVATLLTRVEIDPTDPAFGRPTKPIGPWYNESRAQELIEQNGWSFRREGGRYRRLVASPLPQRILELRAIELLIDAGHIVVCVGGGGIPLARGKPGSYHGVEAVIDKDRSAALLAKQLGADRLLMLTDVPVVWEDWPEPADLAIRAAPVQQLAKLSFEEGTMKPKILAAIDFVRDGRGIAAIGALSDAVALIEESAGTIVRTGAGPIDYYPAYQVAEFRSRIRR